MSGRSGVAEWTLLAARVALAVLTLVALGVQFESTAAGSAFKSVNFFSFFTVLSNLLAAFIFLYLAAFGRRTRPFPVAFLRGMSTFAMTVTFIVFALLLQGLQEELQTTIPWVDTVLHRVMPIAVMADWLIDPPHHRIPLRAALSWLGYPVVYMVYTLIRGEIVDWYPYPFMDANKHGYDGLAVNFGVMFAGFVAVALGVMLVGNLLRSRAPWAAASEAAA